MYNKLLQNCFDERLKRQEINEKEAGNGIFFKKNCYKIVKANLGTFQHKGRKKGLNLLTGD